MISPKLEIIRSLESGEGQKEEGRWMRVMIICCEMTVKSGMRVSKKAVTMKRRQ